MDRSCTPLRTAKSWKREHREFLVRDGGGSPEGPSLWTRTAVMYYSIHFIQRFPTSLLRYLQACSKVLLNVCTWDQLGFDTLRGEPVRVQPAGWRSGKCLGKPFPWHEQWSPKQQWSAAAGRQNKHQAGFAGHGSIPPGFPEIRGEGRLGKAWASCGQVTRRTRTLSISGLKL